MLKSPPLFLENPLLLLLTGREEILKGLDPILKRVDTALLHQELIRCPYNISLAITNSVFSSSNK